MRKGVLRNPTKFTGKPLCQSLKPATLLNKTLAQVFYCEFCENSKNIFFTEHLRTTASEFITETLIFRSVLKNFTIPDSLSNNKPSFTEHLRWLLLNFCGSKYFFVAEYGIYCWQSHRFRSSHQRCSVRKGVLTNFAKFTGKHLCLSLFFNKVAGLWPATLLKKRSGTGVFLWILRNF